MTPEKEKKLLKSEISRNFLKKCMKDLDNFDADLMAIIDQLEEDARGRIIDSYHQNLKKDFS